MRTQDDLKTVETGLITWTDEWEKAISGLGLKPDTHPETAMETFDHLVSFFKKFDQSEELRKRIYGMDKVKEEFDRRVHAFAESIGIKAGGQDALTIAGQLHQDLNAAREARASLIKITDQLDEKNQEIKDVTITIRQSHEKISELKTRAGVDTVEELVAAGEKSHHKRDLLKQIETLEQELTRNGDGFGIEALEAEVNISDIDGIEGDIDRISSELRELQSERDTLRDQLYLDLRMATLEQHLKKGEPMPFVVDDILIGFDDHRTRVCLEILAQLSTRIQVLIFTHHRRVLELADTCNETDRIFQHALS